MLVILVVYGEVLGKVLECKYNNVFFCSYMEYNLLLVVFVDIGKLEMLDDNYILDMLFYCL